MAGRSGIQFGCIEHRQRVSKFQLISRARRETHAFIRCVYILPLPSHSRNGRAAIACRDLKLDVRVRNASFHGTRHEQ